MSWLRVLVGLVLHLLRGKPLHVPEAGGARVEAAPQAPAGPVEDEPVEDDDADESLAKERIVPVPLRLETNQAWHTAANAVWPDMKPSYSIIAALAEARVERVPDMDNAQFAYAVATVAHECGFRPRNEMRARQGTKLRQMQDRYWASGFFGRGLSQITWEDNYRRFGKILGIDLVGSPELAGDDDIGAAILLIGIDRGLFRRGHHIARYINEGAADDDWAGARAVYNGDGRFETMKLNPDTGRAVTVGEKIGSEAMALLDQFNQLSTRYEV
jgi:hypothetical protein